MSRLASPADRCADPAARAAACRAAAARSSRRPGPPASTRRHARSWALRARLPAEVVVQHLAAVLEVGAAQMLVAAEVEPVLAQVLGVREVSWLVAQESERGVL